MGNAPPGSATQPPHSLSRPDLLNLSIGEGSVDPILAEDTELWCPPPTREIHNMKPNIRKTMFHYKIKGGAGDKASQKASTFCFV